MNITKAYDILGLDAGTSRKDVKTAYRKLVKIYHPDKNDAPNAAEVFQSVQKAWECIQNASEEEIAQFQMDTAQQKRVEEVSRRQYKTEQQNPTSTATANPFAQGNQQFISAKTYCEWGSIKAKQGDYHFAIYLYTQSIQLDPNLALTYRYRGNAKFSLGEYAAAIVDYTTAVKLQMDLFTACYNRGNAKFSLGDYVAAKIDYESATRHKKDLALTYQNRGHARAALGQRTAAIADYTTAISLNPN